MVRLDMEAAEQLLRGKTPREIYDIVRERCSQSPGGSISDFFEQAVLNTDAAHVAVRIEH